MADNEDRNIRVKFSSRVEYDTLRNLWQDQREEFQKVIGQRLTSLIEQLQLPQAPTATWTEFQTLVVKLISRVLAA